MYYIEPNRPTSVPIPDNNNNTNNRGEGELRRLISLQSYVPEQLLDLNEIIEEHNHADNNIRRKYPKEEECSPEEHSSAEEDHSRTNEMILNELVAIMKTHNVSFRMVFWSVIQI